MITTPRITCAKCRRLVDRIEWYDDMLNRIVHAYCHGDVDTMAIDTRDLKTIEALQQATDGEAFAVDRLPEASAPPAHV